MRVVIVHKWRQQLITVYGMPDWLKANLARQSTYRFPVKTQIREETAMYCPNCAAPIDGVKFCRSCGSNVSLIPQAMSGQLPQSDDSEGKRRHRHHHWDWGHGHHLKKEPSIERATSCFFSGIGFLLAAMFVVFLSPPGVWWGWVFLFPAFGMIGAGVGQYLQLKEQQRQQKSLDRPEARPVAHQPPGESPALSAPTTSELVKPSSVTEHTTRHLESSRPREEKNDQ